MLGRFWGKKTEKKKEKKKKSLKDKEELIKIEEKQVEPKAKKAKVGKFQIIETKLKYKYTMKDLFEIMMDLRPPATDLHISTGFPPYFRYKGELLASDLPQLTLEETRRLLYEYCPEKKIQEFENNWSVDFCNEIPGLTRITGKLRRENNAIGGMFRKIFSNTLSIDQLKLPKVYKDIARKENGLIIISGPSCSGKTSTIGALVKFISNTRSSKIIILESPIEFIHPTKKSLVVHKEVGIDINTYSEGIKQSLLEDPDILVIGNIENMEIMSLALKAVQMGILVIGGFYTKGSVKTIERILKLFPEAQRDSICLQLSEHLNAVISQVIVKTNDTSGKKLITDVLLPTPEIKVLIKEGNTFQLPVIMGRSKSEGMQTLDEELENLLKQDKISIDTAREYCVDPTRFN